MRHRVGLGRLRYWLHPDQAPKYGPGFNASEGRGALRWRNDSGVAYRGTRRMSLRRIVAWAHQPPSSTHFMR